MDDLPKYLHDENLIPYSRKRNELSLEEGCLTWGNRLRNEVLNMLHDQHLGIVRMKMLARSVVWSPSIAVDIQERVKKYGPCQQNVPIFSF